MQNSQRFQWQWLVGENETAPLRSQSFFQIWPTSNGVDCFPLRNALQHITGWWPSDSFKFQEVNTKTRSYQVSYGITQWLQSLWADTNFAFHSQWVDLILDTMQIVENNFFYSIVTVIPKYQCEYRLRTSIHLPDEIWYWEAILYLLLKCFVGCLLPWLGQRYLYPTYNVW